jgi:hypothetical protein
MSESGVAALDHTIQDETTAFSLGGVRGER